MKRESPDHVRCDLWVMKRSLDLNVNWVKGGLPHGYHQTCVVM